jgi:hypothetical protein
MVGRRVYRGAVIGFPTGSNSRPGHMQLDSERERSWAGGTECTCPAGEGNAPARQQFICSMFCHRPAKSIVLNCVTAAVCHSSRLQNPPPGPIQHSAHLRELPKEIKRYSQWAHFLQMVHPYGVRSPPFWIMSSIRVGIDPIRWLTISTFKASHTPNGTRTNSSFVSGRGPSTRRDRITQHLRSNFSP